MPATLVSAVAYAAAALVGPASAAPNTIYCLNGVTTTLPATITASSISAGTRSVAYTEYFASIDIPRGGVVDFGYVTADAEWEWLLSPASLEPGYATVTIAAGECTSRPGVTHVGVCKLLPRGDGTTGLFQQITVADWNEPDGKYFDAPAASWVEGLGLICDNPVALGYKAAGYTVAWGGKPDPGHDPKGVRGSGFTNIYPDS